MFPVLARRLRSSGPSAALPWWRRLAQQAASAPCATVPPSAVGQRALLASFPGGPSGSSSRSRPFQQPDGGNGGISSTATTGATNPLGVPHFEIRVYDMEEALEALTRQHSVPLGYVLPVEDRPAPSVDGPPLTAEISAAALPRIAPATAAADVSSCEEMEGEGEMAEGAMHCIKRTYQPSVLKRKRAHGFLSRLANSKGKKILARRRQKHRSRMGV